ncbi:protein phosphatase inhibitor 2 [Tetranychus urticae]|uniref:Uncharacterized protein n=1 Tax=Tetranychus urticae TaxID=32264 RepID=T1JTY2_TETUR|nr:protein phosphatase inhibitor 2 [Tetranychus urticae]
MFTRGGAAKRIFKPTIPATRRSTRSGDKDGDKNNSCNTSTPHGKVKSKDKDRSNKSKGKKDLIQLDAVFNGINATAPVVKAERGYVNSGSSNINSLKDRAIKGEDADVKSINGIRIKSEDDSVTIANHRSVEDAKDFKKHEIDDVESIQRALYRDDFISNFSTNDDELAPIGWEHVSQLQLYKQKGCEKDVKSTRRFDAWASTKNNQDKMVLFQLPEMVLKGGDGRLGKIRMYKSGKMELVDTRSGIVYDLLHTDCDVNNQLATKDDDDNSSEEESDADEVMKELNEKQKSSSTDWIKKEVEDETANNQNFPPPLPSSSKSQSIYSKTNHQNYTDKCDKNEDEDDDDDDDDDDNDDDDDRKLNQSYREAVSFDGNQIVCLGPISKNDLLIGRPRLEIRNLRI